uniref:Exostosin domain-containing protein n=2 Tax=Caenorhabditis tropicalis TaxID=1561998 RepID=A0A1I7T527_9PELO
MKHFQERFEIPIGNVLMPRFSEHITNDPNEACIFLLGIDTTDRDIRSQNYVKNVNEYIESLDPAYWNNGRNHLIFNFYHGTFPDYDDHNLNFDSGEAMIARASSSENNFFKGFDVSLPLFHENHPYEIDSQKMLVNDRTQVYRKYLVSFKGKRYVYGIGSGTRNLVHHLHNGEDIVMVTTCKHNNDWQAYQDDRCQKDNNEYDQWDYEDLLANSTFCLVPRGRRLGSFRFLETLRSGCIPVVISDSWILPFTETIDWHSAAIVVAERDALSIPELLMSTSRGRVRELRDSARDVYDGYLRSIQVISNHVLSIISKRIDDHFEQIEKSS